MKTEFYKAITENNPSYKKEAIIWISIQSLASKCLDLQAIAWMLLILKSHKSVSTIKTV